MSVVYDGPKSTKTKKGEAATPRHFEMTLRFDMTGTSTSLTRGRITELMDNVESTMQETLKDIGVEFNDLHGEWKSYYPMHFGRVVS